MVAQPLALSHHRLTTSRPATRNPWTAYNHALQARPLATKSVTSVIGFALGDLIAQLATANASSQRSSNASRPNLDIGRMARMGIFGGALAGPLGHYWFQFLDKRIMPANPTKPLAVVLKCVLDQTLMSPFGTFLFFVSSQAMLGHPEAVVPTLREKFVPTVASSYKLWPAAHVVNFAVIPSSQRVLYTTIVSVVWTFMLSSMAAKPPAGKEA